jgi:hypothetical protein
MGAAVIALTTLAAAAGAVVQAIEADGKVVDVAILAALAGAAVAWFLRGELRPGQEGNSSWWFVPVAFAGSLFVAASDAVQLVILSFLAGFLVVICSVVAGRLVALSRPAHPADRLAD